MCAIGAWTSVWFLSGVQLHSGKPASRSSRDRPRDTLADSVPGAGEQRVLRTQTKPQIPLTAGPKAARKQKAPQPPPPGRQQAPRTVAKSAHAAGVAAAATSKEVQRGAKTRMATSADVAATGQVNETSVDVLLARARQRGGLYLRSFEQAVRNGMAPQELMHDPYPPDLELHEEQFLPFADDSEFGGFQQDPQSQIEQFEANQAPRVIFRPQPREPVGASGASNQDFEESSAGQPDDGKRPSCKFENNLDYLGKDVGTVEGLTDQACCELCARKGDSCMVAVMSSPYDEPPRACWLKIGVRKAVKKTGVRACWPPSRKKVWIDSLADM